MSAFRLYVIGNGVPIGIRLAGVGIAFVTIMITVLAGWYIVRQMNRVKDDVIYERRKIRYGFTCLIRYYEQYLTIIYQAEKTRIAVRYGRHYVPCPRPHQQRCQRGASHNAAPGQFSRIGYFTIMPDKQTRTLVQYSLLRLVRGLSCRDIYIFALPASSRVSQ
jgi:hypothetical protein